MKKILFFSLIICCVAGTAGAQIIRAFSQRYHNPSVRGNIVYVSNSIVTTAGIGSGNPGTGEAPPGGSSRNNSGTAMNINVDATTIIPFGSSWKYWSNTQANFQANWETVAYNDAAWPAGNSELGYGDSDEATCIPSGGGGALCLPTGNKWITAYFRKTINIANPSLYANYIFNVERDDGYIVYVNGTEVARNNMPGGAVTWATGATAAVEDAVVSFTVPNTAFVAGTNVIAVEIHQASIVAGPLSSSSDLSFNLELTGSSVTNSSTADLSLPSCATVLWAGLYWGAGQGTDGTTTGWITGETNCKLKLPGAGSYSTINSSQNDYHNAALAAGLNHTGYKCFADITSLINTSSPNGTYSVADVVSPVGINNGYGGWTIVVAYQNDAEIIRELNVFDGNGIVDQGQPPIDIDLSGFNTPATGPVTCELGAVLYDGDRTSLDSFSFKQNGAASFLNLTPNATANLNDMWNSTIAYKGSVITTRNPAFQNTLGYDANIIDLPNAANANLGNNQTAATIRLASPAENFILQVVTATISIKNPYLRLQKNSTDVNGGALIGGDELKYDIQFNNNGTDSSINSFIIDTIPVGTSYKPGSILINGVAKTDAAGDDQAEFDNVNNRVIFRVGTGATSAAGGRVLVGSSGTVSFSVYVPNICFVRNCLTNISNQATVNYTGATSGDVLNNVSGNIISGCFVPNPKLDVVTGVCRSVKDTIITNICPVTFALIPATSFIGYRFYTALPFIPANIYNPAVPVTTTRVIYAFWNGPGICDDTVNMSFVITSCPDIDDDNDGIPDYVELNNPVALQDADSDGIPNWNDNSYPGFTDLNTDGFNDNFDPSADSDNDGIPNFYDNNFPGYTDSNSDGVNDNMDKDLDGIPNHLDLDSDNDGIPDTAESFGVDANGDGIIDNYSDTDNDGLSQNVDGSAGGVAGSGLALGALDTDGDGIGNYLDLDSDNDGIPDITEAYATDLSNSARVSVFADTDADGYADALDADVGNDNIAENSAASILRTGTDANNDGRTDTWPNKNMDGDARPNPYDLDSDGDGISDVKEAQFTDTDWNAQVDGAINTNGRNSVLAALPALTIPNTDGTGRTNPFDIDSDDDGIPDNVEGMSTIAYILPGTIDTDNDGIINTYDNFAGFGGDGIHPVDKDGDSVPDYLDSDTDNDGLIDRIEGNDFNFNAFPDDNVTLTGLDTDGDGLDNRFDANNSSVEGTSAYMGNGGSTSGDPTPGSITVVQHTWIADGLGCTSERDWRCTFYVLHCDITTFRAALHNQLVRLDWTVLCRQEVDHFIVQRSTDRNTFTTIGTVEGRPVVNESESYFLADNNIASLNTEIIYYRLISVSSGGQRKISNIITVRKSSGMVNDMQVLPNPVKDQLQVLVTITASGLAEIVVLDVNGRVLMKNKEILQSGSNTLTYHQVADLPSGVYYVRLSTGETVLTKRFSLIK